MTSLSSVRRLIAGALLALFASPAFSDYVVNQIDYVDPDTGMAANWTQLWSGNKHGTVLGQASSDGGATLFGFVYDSASGNYARLPLPPGFDNVTRFASVIGINDAGVMVGATSELDGTQPEGCLPEECEPRFISRGLILREGLYNFFSAPGWANTFARTIGNSTPAHPEGLVAGHVDDGIFESGQSWRGVVYDPATANFLTLDTVDAFAVLPHGQNASGRIVGSLIPLTEEFTPQQWGFIFTPAVAGDPMQGGSVNYLQISGVRTFFRGLNDQGLIAATVRSRTADFFKDDTYIGDTVNGFQPISVPSDNNGPRCENFFIRGLFPEHLNNAGQVFGQYVDSDCNMHGFVATPASLPTGATFTAAHRFSVDVLAGAPTFISVPTATGYFYAAGFRDPAIATVRLPLGFGDNKFVLMAGFRAFAVNAGQLFDFRAHGFANGVRAFSVACIDPAARLHPVNSKAFPTELTFVGAGRFTGVQQPFPDLTDRGFPPPSSAECRQALLSLRQ
jgi:hypothetical protein